MFFYRFLSDSIFITPIKENFTVAAPSLIEFLNYTMAIRTGNAIPRFHNLWIHGPNVIDPLSTRGHKTFEHWINGPCSYHLYFVKHSSLNFLGKFSDHKKPFLQDGQVILLSDPRILDIDQNTWFYDVIKHHNYHNGNLSLCVFLFSLLPSLFIYSEFSKYWWH